MGGWYPDRFGTKSEDLAWLRHVKKVPVTGTFFVARGGLEPPTS
jgi:hypothetical protein